MPTSVTVGQTGVPASITLENRNTAPDAALTNTVCNSGDASPPCASGEPGIVFVPSCSQLAAGQCTLAGKDPGVIEVASVGTGRAGSACAGMAFTTAVIDATTGATRFTPTGGAHVTLPGSNSSCIIDFNVSVLKAPGADFSAGTPGLQTAQVFSFTSYTGPLGPGALSNFATGSTSGTTVNLATPAISTTASPGFELGSGSISDTATVTGRVNPTGTPSVTFGLYGPDDATCAVAIFSDTVAYPSSGGPVTSGAFTPTAPGTYRWIASYSGDPNNAAVSGACGDAQETVTVVPTTTTTTTAPTTTTAVPTTIASTTTVAPATTVPAAVTTIAEPETTVRSMTTLGTTPVPDFSTDTLPVTGQAGDGAASWGSLLVLVGTVMLVLASTRRRSRI